LAEQTGHGRGIEARCKKEGLLNRTESPDPPQATPTHEAGKKIILNLGGRASKAVKATAAATLEAGGFDPAIAEPKPPQMGDKMPDGTIYAGVSPDTGKAMYAMPSDAPLSYTFNEVQKYPKKLDVYGHQDWRVPTKVELNVLFNNLAAIGGFNVTGSNPAGWYWSTSSYNLWSAWVQRFSDGYQLNNAKGGHSSVRCVRSVSVRDESFAHLNILSDRAWLDNSLDMLRL
jgi:hypothetical protein